MEKISGEVLKNLDKEEDIIRKVEKGLPPQRVDLGKTKIQGKQILGSRRGGFHRILQGVIEKQETREKEDISKNK